MRLILIYICREVRVYDSIFSALTTSLKQQLSDLYLTLFIDDKQEIIFESTQRQVGEVDCAIFAIANAMELCSSGNFSNIQFDQKLMRAHLHQCLVAGTLTPFPKQSFQAFHQKPAVVVTLEYFVSDGTVQEEDPWKRNHEDPIVIRDAEENEEEKVKEKPMNKRKHEMKSLVEKKARKTDTNCEIEVENKKKEKVTEEEKVKEKPMNKRKHDMESLVEKKARKTDTNFKIEVENNKKEKEMTERAVESRKRRQESALVDTNVDMECMNVNEFPATKKFRWNELTANPTLYGRGCRHQKNL